MDNKTKHQLKQPDQFVNLTEQGIEWANQNRKIAILTGVAAVVLLLICVGAYTLFEHRTEEAQTAFGNAMHTYQTPVATPGQELPPGVKTFPDQKTRAAAANAQFLAVANHYGMTEPGKLAKYFAGVTYLEEGQNGSAEDTLKQVAGSWNGNLSALAKMSLAQLYEQTGRDGDAVNLYNELAKGHAATVPPLEAKLQLGDLYASQGKTAEANKIYAEVKDQDKNKAGQPGPAGEIASEKLNEKK